MRHIITLFLIASGCAASSTDETEQGSPPDHPAIDASNPKVGIDADPGSDSPTPLGIDAGTEGCRPGEVIGTAHIANTCYLDCLNACMACDSPTGEAGCGDFYHPGHAPYCGTMTFITCPAGSHSDRTYMDTATPYFPGTQHYGNETYSCICDDHDGGIAR
jgi:hypothetical protein